MLFKLQLRNPRLREAMPPAQGQTSVRSGRRVAKAQVQSPCPPCALRRSVSGRREARCPRHPHPGEGRPAPSQLRGEVGRCGTSRTTGSPDSRRRPRADRPGRRAARRPHIAHSWVTRRSLGLLRAAAPAASGSFRAPLLARCPGPTRFRLLPGPISGVRPPSAPPPLPPPRCCPGPVACPGRSAARSPPSRR